MQQQQNENEKGDVRVCEITEGRWGSGDQYDGIKVELTYDVSLRRADPKLGSKHSNSQNERTFRGYSF